MHLRLYNTLTKSEAEFTPLDPAGKRVTFYSCGPTVYDYAHIGNFRSFLNADVLRRTLELLGYDVHHVMNITDVGHMTDDADADGGGEDKMAVAAKRLLEQKKSGKLPAGAGANLDPSDPYAIANFYADAFLDDARTLGLKIAFDVLKKPEVMPRPTRMVPEMVAMIQRLIKNGHAYVASDGVVYFDVQSFPAYGKLSGNTPDAIRAGEGGRVSQSTIAVKKHPADFMLWKPDAKHVMKWDSPWGAGYPGWHIECSAMAATLLGETIDLHSGGEDNIFPHHECEIAQTCASTGQPTFARYWFHTRHLIVEGEKMSKSKGNFFTVRDLLAKGASPAAIRLEIIKTHYRSNANFTLQGLQDSQRMIERWGRLEAMLKSATAAKPQAAPGPLAGSLVAFKSALCADLNVAGAIGVLNEAVGKYKFDEPLPDVDVRAELQALQQMNSVLGVLDLQREGQMSNEEQVNKLREEREQARKNKDWKRADEIRDQLLRMNVGVQDTKGGTNVSVIIDVIGKKNEGK